MPTSSVGYARFYSTAWSMHTSSTKCGLCPFLIHRVDAWCLLLTHSWILHATKPSCGWCLLLSHSSILHATNPSCELGLLLAHCVKVVGFLISSARACLSMIYKQQLVFARTLHKNKFFSGVKSYFIFCSDNTFSFWSYSFFAETYLISAYFMTINKDFDLMHIPWSLLIEIEPPRHNYPFI